MVAERLTCQSLVVDFGKMMKNPYSSVFLFVAMVLTAAGYGGTFLLAEHFAALGGNEVAAGQALLGAAMGTIMSVPLTGYMVSKCNPIIPAALGSVFVAVGYAILSVMYEISALGVVSGFFIGFGWGAFYLAAPIALSERVADSSRVFWFMLLAAVQMAGIGGGPYLFALLRGSFDISTQALFLILALSLLAAALAAAAFWWSNRNEPIVRSPFSFRRVLRVKYSRSQLFPVLMVFVGACFFSAILTFQSSIAIWTGFPAEYFYLTYTLSVVFSRFIIGPLLLTVSPVSAARSLVGLLCAGTFLFCFSAGILSLYMFAIILIGTGYGLAYPVIQAMMINSTPQDERNEIMTVFVVAYFVGVFGFPAFAGWIIVFFGVPFLLLCLLALTFVDFAICYYGTRTARLPVLR